MSTATTISEMHLDGGIACLDFVNSAFNTEQDVVVERLRSYDDILILSGRLKLLDEPILENLKVEAAKNIRQAQRVLEEARIVRQSMFKVFTALANKKPGNIQRDILDDFNAAIRSAISKRAFSVSASEMVLTWDNSDLMLPVWAFTLSAYELMVHEDQHLIKKCSGCEWLFLDKTKNHRRRWCDMQTCGSSEKSRRYYQKSKAKKWAQS